MSNGNGASKPTLHLVSNARVTPESVTPAIAALLGLGQEKGLPASSTGPSEKRPTSEPIADLRFSEPSRLCPEMEEGK